MAHPRRRGAPLIFWLASAWAAPPFEAGPLEPVPGPPTAIAIAHGELLVSTADALWVRGSTDWQDTGLPPSNAIVVESASAFLLCGPTGVQRVTLDIETLSETPCLDLVDSGDAIWSLTADGVLDLATGEPVELPGATALGGGPEAAWLADSALHVGDAQRLVFPGATDLVRLDADGLNARWALVHPERRLLGLLGESGLESAWPQPIRASVVGFGDLSEDGEPDVVIAGEDGWLALTFTRPKPPAPAPVPAPVVVAPPRPAPAPRPRYEPPQTSSILGMRMPNFGGLEPDPEYDQIFVGGFGVAVGNALGPNQLSVGFSPAASGGIERGAKRIRTFIGADSAPLFAWVGQTGGIHLAMATAGFSVGSDRLRAGPFASIGLLGAGAGLRAVFTPFESRAGKLTGFEGRLTWYAPSAGHASLYYVSAFPLGRRYGPAYERSTRRSMCHRMGFGLGAAAGASSTELAWEFVGRDVGYQVSGSPAFSIACENGGRSTGWTLGGETAPFFFYRVPTTGGGDDRRLHHMGTMTLGLFAGGNKARLGPIVTGGIWSVGAGFRAVVTPFTTRESVHHGIELRAVALFPSSPAAQGMLLYHVWFDPKFRRKSEEVAP